MTDKVQEFWDTQATVHKADGRATAPDHFYRDMEISRIIDHIGENDSVLDVGCGNGYSTIKFTKARPRCAFYGIDYSPEMIFQARAQEDVRIDFRVMDIRKPLEFKPGRDGFGLFDTIISERCLINLANWGEQQQALLHMKRALKPRGQILLVENTLDGLKKLNTLRKQFGLSEIEMRWHNHYLPHQDFMDFCSSHFDIEHCANIGGMYYVISRVIYAAMAQKSREMPDYDHVINELAAQLPFIPCPYSPNMLYILRNRP